MEGLGAEQPPPTILFNFPNFPILLFISELKILHNFSHFTSFDRATKHSELVFRIQDVIEDLYKILENDEPHLNSLREGI